MIATTLITVLGLFQPASFTLANTDDLWKFFPEHELRSSQRDLTTAQRPIEISRSKRLKTDALNL